MRIIKIIGEDSEAYGLQIAKTTGYCPVTVTKILVELVKKGLLNSEREYKNLRRNKLTLTYKGRKVYESVIIIYDAVGQSWIDE